MTLGRKAYLKQQRRLAGIRVQEFLLKKEGETKDEAEQAVAIIAVKGRENAVRSRRAKKEQEATKRQMMDIQRRQIMLQKEKKEIDPTVVLARRSSRVGMEGIDKLKQAAGLGHTKGDEGLEKLAQTIADYRRDHGGGGKVELIEGDGLLRAISKQLPLRGSITPSRVSSDEEEKPWRLPEEKAAGKPLMPPIGSTRKTLTVPGAPPPRPGSSGNGGSSRPGSGLAGKLAITIPGGGSRPGSSSEKTKTVEGDRAPHRPPSFAGVGHAVKTTAALRARPSSSGSFKCHPYGADHEKLPNLPRNQDMKGFDLGRIVMEGEKGAPPGSGRGSRRPSFVITTTVGAGNAPGPVTIKQEGFWIPSNSPGGVGMTGGSASLYSDVRERGELGKLSNAANPKPKRRASLDKAIMRGEKRRNSLSSILSADDLAPIEIPALSAEIMMAPTHSDILLNAMCVRVVAG